MKYIFIALTKRPGARNIHRNKEKPIVVLYKKTVKWNNEMIKILENITIHKKEPTALNN